MESQLVAIKNYATVGTAWTQQRQNLRLSNFELQRDALYLALRGKPWRVLWSTSYEYDTSRVIWELLRYFLNVHRMDTRTHTIYEIWEVLCQKRVSRAGTNNYIPQNLWGVITCPCPWHLLLVRHSPYNPWASYEICKIEDCACAGNIGNVFPDTAG